MQRDRRSKFEGRSGYDLFADEELKAFAGAPVPTRVLVGLLATLVAMCVLPTASSQDCAHVVRDYRDSVVSVEIKKTAKDTGAVDTMHGTGFIVDQDGHVLTSRSLLFKEGKDTDPEALRISGAIRSERATKMPMEYLTSSEIGDVAVLRFTDTSQTWRAISLGDPWSIQNGQSICFMGFPLDIEFLMKPGTVTGKGASKGWWYSDIPYNFGAGGAPVFDSRNEKLIGIVGVSVRSEAEARGVGYIVPINLAYPLLQQFANIDIKREAAQTLASGLQGLQPTTGNTATSPALPQTPPTMAEAQVLRDRGMSILESMWPTAQIPVCWENPSPEFQHEMLVVRQEVSDTWERASRLRFTGWQQCATENRGLRILIDDVNPHTEGFGRKLDGLRNGITLNLIFEKYDHDCQTKRDYCIKAYAGHEFGHAIGFAHTHSRPDAPESCKQRMAGNGRLPAEPPVVSWQLTPYDPESIMNYCNPKFYNDGNLSELDVLAVRQLYGAPATE